MPKTRLDQALVQLQLAPSRTKAKELILGPGVSLKLKGQSETVKDPARMVDLATEIEISLIEDVLLKYVSRAGFKLEGALKHVSLSLHNFVCLDAGQSTGGFTQVLIEGGANEVIGFDVGHGQLHAKIKLLSQVKSFEGINAKEAHLAEELKDYLGKVDLIVGDLSFISTKHYFSSLLPFLKSNGHLLFLIKPQFELDRASLNKKGVVSDIRDYEKVEQSVKAHAQQLGLKLVDYFESCIVGQDGNREFFIYAKKI